MKLYLLLLVFGFVFVTGPAHALIELRGHIAAHQTNIDVGEGFPEIKALPGFGADVLVDLPLVPFGFGLRYEQLGAKAKDSTLNTELEVKTTRTSVLINKRFVDTLLFLGVIGSIGLSQKATVDLAIGSNKASFDAENDGLNYTIGVEGGGKLLGLMVGGELGYAINKFKDDSGVDGPDMGGTYVKLMLGFGF